MKKIDRPTNLKDAIKQKCYFDCCAQDVDNYKNCNCTSCALWEFRLGDNPYKKQKFSAEQKAEIRTRLLKSRGKL